MNLFDDSKQKVDDDQLRVEETANSETPAPQPDDTANDVIEKIDEGTTDMIPGELSSPLDGTELVDPIQELKGRVDS